MVASGTSSVGPVKLTKEVVDVTTSIPLMVEQMTGLEIREKIGAVKKKTAKAY